MHTQLKHTCGTCSTVNRLEKNRHNAYFNSPSQVVPVPIPPKPEPFPDINLFIRPRDRDAS
jgi:hypothetical protein